MLSKDRAGRDWKNETCFGRRLRKGRKREKKTIFIRTKNHTCKWSNFEKKKTSEKKEERTYKYPLDVQSLRKNNSR